MGNQQVRNFNWFPPIPLPPSSPKYQPPITIHTRTHAHRSTASTDDEMDDQQVQKLLIVTQTSTTTVVSAAYKKHPGGDRTGNFVTRSKMDSDLAQAINDGLYFYEQVLYVYTCIQFSRLGIEVSLGYTWYSLLYLRVLTLSIPEQDLQDEWEGEDTHQRKVCILHNRLSVLVAIFNFRLYFF